MLTKNCADTRIFGAAVRVHFWCIFNVIFALQRIRLNMFHYVSAAAFQGPSHGVLDAQISVQRPLLYSLYVL